MRLIYNECASSFEDILKISHEKTIHKQNFEFLAKVIYNFINGLLPPLMSDVITFRKHPYKTCKSIVEYDAILPYFCCWGLRMLCGKEKCREWTWIIHTMKKVSNSGARISRLVIDEYSEDYLKSVLISVDYLLWMKNPVVKYHSIWSIWEIPVKKRVIARKNY